MVYTLLCEVISFGIYFVYGSFFEWFFHRYLFHSPKYVYRTFREHTLVHHQIYKHDDTYHTHDDHPHKVPMDWWALPLMVLWHLPLLWFVQWATGIPSLWGGVAAIAVYYGLYESFHWAMHVPRASAVLGRWRYYRFLDTHHRVHHKHMLSNLNVILPVADLLLGTLRDGQGRKVQIWKRPSRTPAPVPTQAVTSQRAAAPEKTPPCKKPSRASNRYSTARD